MDHQSPSEKQHMHHISCIFKRYNTIVQMNLGKGEVHPRTGHDGPER